jgi:Effector Associated Constant Component 1
MDAQIQVSGGDEVEEFTDLWRWLREERAPIGTVRAIPRPTGQGEMGGAFDMLSPSARVTCDRKTPFHSWNRSFVTTMPEWPCGHHSAR